MAPSGAQAPAERPAGRCREPAGPQRAAIRTQRRREEQRRHHFSHPSDEAERAPKRTGAKRPPCAARWVGRPGTARPELLGPCAHPRISRHKRRVPRAPLQSSARGRAAPAALLARADGTKWAPAGRRTGSAGAARRQSRRERRLGADGTRFFVGAYGDTARRHHSAADVLSCSRGLGSTWRRARARGGCAGRTKPQSSAAAAFGALSGACQSAPRPTAPISTTNRPNRLLHRPALVQGGLRPIPRPLGGATAVPGGGGAIEAVQMPRPDL